MTDETWKRDRMRLIGEQNRSLFVGPALESDLEKQRFKVALFVRECVDAGFDVVNLLQMLGVGMCWLGDQANVSRENLAKMIHEVRFPENVNFTNIITPR